MGDQSKEKRSQLHSFPIYLLTVILTVSVIVGVWGYVLVEPRPSDDVSLKASDQKEEVIRVGLSMAEGENAWSQNLYNHIKDAMTEVGEELIYYAPEENSESGQYQAAVKLLEDGIDYLLLIPRSEQAISPIAVEAAKYDVPVILISGENEKNNLCAVTITVDYEREGQLCAQILTETYVDKECNIAVVLGPSDSSIAKARLEGFRKEVEVRDNMQILKTIEGDFDQIVARDAMSELLRNNPKGTINAVFACGDEDGLGVLHALKLGSYQPGKDISIVSIGGIQDAVKAVITGEYLATVGSGRHLSEVAAEMILRLENGEDQSRHVVIPYQCLDSSSTWHELLQALY